MLARPRKRAMRLAAVGEIPRRGRRRPAMGIGSPNDSMLRRRRRVCTKLRRTPRNRSPWGEKKRCCAQIEDSVVSSPRRGVSITRRMNRQASGSRWSDREVKLAYAIMELRITDSGLVCVCLDLVHIFVMSYTNSAAAVSVGGGLNAGMSPPVEKDSALERAPQCICSML